MRLSLPLCLVLSFALSAGVFATQRPPVVKGDGGTLTYVAEANGDRLPDFSSAGYGGGGVPLPAWPARVVVEPVDGDDGARLQAAIDFVSSLPADAEGCRGVVQLASGRFEVAGQLVIRSSGVVLRGAGAGQDGTLVLATGTGRRALISVSGDSTPKLGEAIGVTDEYVAVGAAELSVADASRFKPGDLVQIARPATKEWIHALGADESPGRQQFNWKAPAFTLIWERAITTVNGARLAFNAPITTALEKRFGGGTVAALTVPGRLERVGVEALACVSEYDRANPLDEEHAWDAVTMDGVRDGWVRGVTARHFAGSAIHIGAGCRRVTVQDCVSLDPVSELGGYRRHTFHTDGQQTLFLRCRAEDGRNDFTVGYLAGGPNVFLECTAEHSCGFSGSTGSWASGILFDNVTLDGATLELGNREIWNQGVNWAAANSMLWQCSAPVVICRTPPTAHNWADGVWGQFVGDGYWSQVNEFIRPQSLYRAQLGARTPGASLAALAPQAAPAAARGPRLEEAVPDLTARLRRKPPGTAGTLALSDGWLAVGGRLLGGRERGLAWWRGRLLPNVEPTNASITRFSPGLSGPIHTDDLEQLTDAMVKSNQVVMRHHYGLWYDRRRMDHERMRRPDGDVWPPFFEQPFARSGQGSAWDGLSKYDLTRYNPWYFDRLKEFATLARAKGLVLIDEMYFQHNILEAGAHWVDVPWRPVNNINDTWAQFPEPVPFDGDTVKMAARFYDLSDAKYRALHRAYIRHHLDVLGDQPNVLYTLSAENSGPLSFMQFWLDVIGEWKRETGRHPLIALSACKDVQDAILADPERAPLIDVIDLTYWFRTDAGKEFAPAGGTDLAPRQHQRLWKGGRPSAASIRGMAQEYREKFPGKAVITGLDEAGNVQPQ